MATGTSKMKSATALNVDESHDAALARLEQLIHAGLCSNCRHAGDCAALMRASEPITQCEMHECGLSSRPRLSLVRQQTAAAEEKGPDQETLLGLCENCDHVKACRLPKPLSGVWECEEYA
jgi:hypothetical protein